MWADALWTAEGGCPTSRWSTASPMRMNARTRHGRTQLAVGDGVSPAALDLSRHRRIAPPLQREREREAGEADDEADECVDDVVVRGEDDGGELRPRQHQSEATDER